MRLTSYLYSPEETDLGIEACEIAYYIFEGGPTVWDGLVHFQLAVTLGNTIGGVLFIAIPNYFQTPDDRFREWERLTWREWIRGIQRA